MAIRPFQPKDAEAVKRICLLNADLESEAGDCEVSDYILRMFCRYYIEQEPELCLVATDELDVPYGYIYGTKDFGSYRLRFAPYLAEIYARHDMGRYAEAVTEMYDHFQFSAEYPAHLHIDVLDGFRSLHTGTKLLEAFCSLLKERGVSGVMLIVGSDNVRGRHFYEKNGFRLLCEKPSGASYGIKLSKQGE